MKTRFNQIADLVYRQPSMSKASYNMAEMQTLVMCSTFINFFRFYAKEDQNTNIKFYPSILCMLNVASGAGKNAGIRYLQGSVFESCISQMKIDFEEESKKYILAKTSALIKKADKEMASVKHEAKTKEFAKIKKNAEKSKRSYTILTDPQGSYEGFAFDRAYMAEIPVGSPSFISEEYGDKILLSSKLSYLQALYNALFELIDKDELSPKSIKDIAGETPPSKGMGLTLYLTFSSISQEGWNKIKDSILQTVGRRGFIVRETFETLAKEMSKKESISNADPSVIESISFDLVQIYNLMKNANKEMKLSEEARKFYESLSTDSLKTWHDIASSGRSDELKSMLCAINSDTDRKTLKVAMILSIINADTTKPYNGIIELSHLVEASDIVKRYVKISESIFNLNNESLFIKFQKYINDRRARYITARELVESKIINVPISMRSYQEHVKIIMLEDLQAEANMKGLKITHQKFRKQDRYYLVSMSPEEVSEVQLEDDQLYVDALNNFKTS